ncbi:MAG: winged helix-turn-helix transcriptional regulator [Alteromonadaceae bacterium]|nr:winged helix-turn-helix transcriptional regulator [Alteromonadaceae bacterium]
MRIRTPLSAGKLKSLLVHEHLIRDHTATGAFLLSNIYFLAAKHGQCFQSVKSMAIRTGISRNTVTRHIKKFIKAGLIARVAREDNSNDIFLIGIHADRTVITAYSELVSNRPKSAESGKLIEVPLGKTVVEKGKRAEHQRFKSFFRAFCTDMFASRNVREGETHAYFRIGSVSRLAIRLGVTRQTLTKILRLFKTKSLVQVVRYDGDTIIDFMFNLNEEIKKKTNQLAPKIYA